MSSSDFSTALGRRSLGEVQTHPGVQDKLWISHPSVRDEESEKQDERNQMRGNTLIQDGNGKRKGVRVYAGA